MPLKKNNFFISIQGIFLILSGTIGAGILGIPFVVSKVGLAFGLLCIAFVGLLVLGLNILVAKVASAHTGPLQLVGLARTYLGPLGEALMLLVMYSMLFGVLLIYLIGEGDTLAALFGGSAFNWALLFFGLASIFVFIGMRLVKIIQVILLAAVLLVLAVILGVGLPHVEFQNLTLFSFDPKNILALYSVLVFSFHATTVIPEIQSIFVKKTKIFKKSVIFASLFCIIIYALFSALVVAMSGSDTTPIATIGLGDTVGPFIKILGNVFAVLAMATGFLMAASSLRDSLKWDFKFSHIAAVLLVCVVPLLFYVFGIRQFIVVMDLVGGVFVSLEMLMMLLIYWRMKHLGKIKKPD